MLIKDIQTIRAIVNLTASVDFDAIKSSIADAENEFIIPVIGQEFYDELDAAYNANTPSLTEEQTAALTKIQKPLAYFATMLWIPEGIIKVSGDGLYIVQTEGMTSPKLWQSDKLELKYLSSGYKNIDSLLEFLEENSADYTTWTESSAYTVYKENFVNNAKLFSSIYSIGNSRRTFLRMKPMMIKCEDFFLRGNLGIAYFNELKTQLAAGSITADNKIVLDYVQKAIVYFTVGKSLEEGLVDFGPDGVYINAFSDGLRTKVQAGDRRIQNMALRAIEDGHSYIRQMKNYLNKTASNSRYQTYKTSDAYSDPANPVTFKNSKDSSTFLAR